VPRQSYSQPCSLPSSRPTRSTPAGPTPPATHRGKLRLGKATVKKGSDILHDPTADFASLQPGQVSTLLVRSGKHNVGTYGLVEVLDAHRIKATPPFRADGSIDYSVGTHHYYDWKLGNCHIFVLDTRGERSHFNRDNLEDPKTFLLGKAQREWLTDGIRNTDAQFVFVVSSVGLVVPHSIYHVRPDGGDKSKGDGFPGFLHERLSRRSLARKQVSEWTRALRPLAHARGYSGRCLPSA
jgi:alkaline phosphatase D